MITEDLTVFLADFGVSVTAGAVSGLGILDMPGEVVFGGVRDASTGAISTSYRLTCLSSEFGTLGYGSVVTVEGVGYLVQEVMPITDGKFCSILMEQTVIALTRLVTLSGNNLLTQDGRNLAAV